MVKHRNIKANQSEEEHTGKIDIALFVIVVALSIFGIIMVFDSSIKLLSNKYHFVLLQIVWVALGLFSMIIISNYNYKKLAKLAVPFMILCLLSLIGVLVVGERINGAVRWINLGFFQFQPSEITKPILILYLASLFAKEKAHIEGFKKRFIYSIIHELLPFLLLVGLILVLIIIGKDLGTAIVIACIAIGMYFVQGTDMISIVNLLCILGVMALGAIFSIIIEPYRIKRLLTFAGSSGTAGSLGSGYQINQVLIAIGSGGWFGKGFTQSIQKQRYLVETTAATDSIFAVIAEEFGFAGSLVFFASFIFLFYRCIHIALKTHDRLGKFIVIGITIWIVTQTILNIAVNVNLVPLTGVPLPFISYGGTSTIVLLSSIGIILNISKYISHNDKPKRR